MNDIVLNITEEEFNTIKGRIYEPHFGYGSLNKRYCHLHVFGGNRGDIGGHQCGRKVYAFINDAGFCKQHFRDLLIDLGRENEIPGNDSEKVTLYKVVFKGGEAKLVSVDAIATNKTYRLVNPDYRDGFYSSTIHRNDHSISLSPADAIKESQRSLLTRKKILLRELEINTSMLEKLTQLHKNYYPDDL